MSKHIPSGKLAGCAGKASFPTFALARARAERRSDGRAPRVFYRCRYCGQIHIGERDVTRERAQRARLRELEARHDYAEVDE